MQAEQCATAEATFQSAITNSTFEWIFNASETARKNMLGIVNMAGPNIPGGGVGMSQEPCPRFCSRIEAKLRDARKVAAAPLSPCARGGLAGDHLRLGMKACSPSTPIGRVLNQDSCLMCETKDLETSRKATEDQPPTPGIITDQQNRFLGKPRESPAGFGSTPGV